MQSEIYMHDACYKKVFQKKVVQKKVVQKKLVLRFYKTFKKVQYRIFHT